MNFPSELKYTKDHEWAKQEGKTVSIGITDHAQQSLGDVVFVELPKVGQELQKGQTFGTIESIKAVSDLYAPIAGKVIEVNTELQNDPAQINQDPYGNAWIIKVEPTGSEISNLLSAKDYSEYVKELK